MRRLALGLALGLAACRPSPTDVAGGEVNEVRAARAARAADAGAPADDAYVHVARRPHAAVGLAEARHLGDAEARAFVERVADDLERCAAGLAAGGALSEGAARVIVVAGPNGAPAVSLKTAPGDAVAQQALLCLVAPIRAALLPPGTGGAPALALEASWHL